MATEKTQETPRPLSAGPKPVVEKYKSWYSANPNRLNGRPPLGKPVMSEPATEVTEVKPVSPTGTPVLPQILVIILTILATLAGGVAAVAAAGVAVPAWVVGIAAAVSSIAAALGIASPGVRKQP